MAVRLVSSPLTFLEHANVFAMEKQMMKSATKMMLSTLMIAAAGALTGTPAHADGHHTEQLNAQFLPSTVTRAQVRAELLSAQRDGSLVRTERNAEHGPDVRSASTRSRAEVKAEAAEANRRGQTAPRLDWFALNAR